MTLLWTAIVITASGWLYALGLYTRIRWDSLLYFFIAFLAAFFLGMTVVSSKKNKTKKFIWTAKQALPALIAIFSVQGVLVFIYLWAAPLENRIPFLSEIASRSLNILGFDTAFHEFMIYLQDFAHIRVINASIEKMALLPILLFVGGGAVMLYYFNYKFLRSVLLLSGLSIIYAILRFMGIIVFYSSHPRLDIFWNPLLILISMIPLAVLTSIAFTFVPQWKIKDKKIKSKGKALVVLPLAFLTAASFSWAAGYIDRGIEKEGRILIEEVHSDWEWTEIPFDRVTYGEQSTYNYRILMKWLRHFYQVDVNETEPITSELLSDYDVVMLKCPTMRYRKEEIEAIVEYVREGGGVYLIGDHNNLFGMNGFLNEVALRFGMKFNYDDTFDLTTGHPSYFSVPVLFAHPAVLEVENLEFQTTCTVKIPYCGERVLVGYGLGREWVDYSHINFFGDITPDSEEGYGVFLLSAAVPFGKGKVLAYTDSTMFSNFSLFFDGVSELAMGSIAYLNRSQSSRTTNLIALITGILLLTATLFLMHFSRRETAVVMFGLGAVSGIIVTGYIISQIHHSAYRFPELKRPYQELAFTKEYGDFRLATMLEYDSPDEFRVFDTFFVNTQRLNLYPKIYDTLKEAMEATDMAVLLNPLGEVSNEDVQAVERFVRSGGKLMILDYHEKDYFETLNAFVEPFGIRVESRRKDDGIYEDEGGVEGESGMKAPSIEVKGADLISVPEEIMPEDEFYIAERRAGEGKVLLVLGSISLSRKYMGRVYNMPDEKQIKRYELQYFLFDQFMDQMQKGDDINE